ncbi:MAG TPA: hypothetical protein VF049_16440 [Nocardioidaceae bacterium]
MTAVSRRAHKVAARTQRSPARLGLAEPGATVRLLLSRLQS